VANATGRLVLPAWAVCVEVRPSSLVTGGLLELLRPSNLSGGRIYRLWPWEPPASLSASARQSALLVVAIDGLDTARDLLDLSLFSRLDGLAALSYSEPPLTLAPGEWVRVRLSSVSSLSLDGAGPGAVGAGNFLFASPSAGSSAVGPDGLAELRDASLQAALVVLLALTALAAVCGCANADQAEKAAKTRWEGDGAEALADEENPQHREPGLSIEEQAYRSAAPVSLGVASAAAFLELPVPSPTNPNPNPSDSNDDSESDREGSDSSDFSSHSSATSSSFQSLSAGSSVSFSFL
jgi:hypothetical protein